ncbi:MAG: hypothetical protein ACD_56C00008G0003 [uncultured bacterium]|nr:MAG: hypothetical protein ACD_56C00008G0003 [uncultured bacterium]
MREDVQTVFNELPRSKLTGYPPKTTVAAGYVIAYNLLSLDF